MTNETNTSVLVFQAYDSFYQKTSSNVKIVSKCEKSLSSNDRVLNWIGVISVAKHRTGSGQPSVVEGEEQVDQPQKKRRITTKRVLFTVMVTFVASVVAVWNDWFNTRDFGLTARDHIVDWSKMRMKYLTELQMDYAGNPTNISDLSTAEWIGLGVEGLLGLALFGLIVWGLYRFLKTRAARLVGLMLLGIAFLGGIGVGAAYATPGMKSLASSAGNTISAAWNGNNPEVVSATRPMMPSVPSITAPVPSTGVEVGNVPQPQQPAPNTPVSEPGATVPVPDSAVQQPVTPDQLSQPAPNPSGIKHWLGEQSDNFMHNATVVRDFGVGLAHDAKRLCEKYCPVIKDHSIQFFNWSLDNVFTVLAVLLLLRLLLVIRRITRNRRLARKYARHLRKQERMKNAFDEHEARWESRLRRDDGDSDES